MHFSDFTIGVNLFKYITSYIPFGSTILELGSGDGTGLLAQYYEVITVEHDPKWMDRHKATYIYAPLKNGWYDLKPPKGYDVIIVDGPPDKGRMGFYENIEGFDLTKPCIIDDTHREEERLLAEKVSKYTGRSIHYIKEENKSAAVI